MSFGCVVFFFKQKTAYEMRISDWSSDVCSSDLTHALFDAAVVVHAAGRGDAHGGAVRAGVDDQRAVVPERDPVGFVQAERPIAFLAPDPIPAVLGPVGGGGLTGAPPADLEPPGVRLPDPAKTGRAPAREGVGRSVKTPGGAE